MYCAKRLACGIYSRALFGSVIIEMTSMIHETPISELAQIQYTTGESEMERRRGDYGHGSVWRREIG